MEARPLNTENLYGFRVLRFQTKRGCADCAHPCFLSFKAGWGRVKAFFKEAGEVVNIRKADLLCHLGDGVGSAPEQARRFVKTKSYQILGRSRSEKLSEAVAEVFIAEAMFFGQFFNI